MFNKTLRLHFTDGNFESYRKVATFSVKPFEHTGSPQEITCGKCLYTYPHDGWSDFVFSLRIRTPQSLTHLVAIEMPQHNSDTYLWDLTENFNHPLSNAGSGVFLHGTVSFLPLRTLPSLNGAQEILKQYFKTGILPAGHEEAHNAYCRLLIDLSGVRK